MPGQNKTTDAFHPDLRLAPFLPRTSITARNLRLARLVIQAGTHLSRSSAIWAQVQTGTSVRVFRPSTSSAASSQHPALLWIHGGGFISGSARQDDKQCQRFADRIGIFVAAIEYRLAPEHPYPTPLYDCYAALRWLARHPQVDANRIAIGGASAGGGLAAALALLAKERGEIRPVLQMLSYPMIDDRTIQHAHVDQRQFRMWNAESNRFGWQSYLGRHMAPGAGDVPPLAAPARYEDLGGVPPAWIGVGTLDLFYSEDVAYARRLREAGVACVLHVVPGAYHGFDVIEKWAPVARDFLAVRMAVLRDAVHGNYSN